MEGTNAKNFNRTKFTRKLSTIIDVVYAHASHGAASYSVLPGLQPHPQTAASAETTVQAAVALTAPAVAATVAVAGNLCSDYR
jgi:hypothetical protein